MTTLRRLTTCTAAVLILVNGTFAETVEEVHTKLNDAYAKLRSYSAKTETTQDFAIDRAKFDGRHAGNIKWMRKGAKIMSRAEQRGQMTQKFEDQVHTAKSSTLTICDGDFYYTIAESSGTGNESGTKSATKQKVDPAALTDAMSIITTQKIDYLLQVLADETVDGADCFVIEGTPKEAGKLPFASTVLWFRKADAIMVKMIEKDKDEKEVYSFVLSNINVNEDIPTDQFKFTAPEGVEVMDMNADMPVIDVVTKEEGK